MDFLKKFKAGLSTDKDADDLTRKVIRQSVESEQWLRWQEKLSKQYNINRNENPKTLLPKAQPINRWFLGIAAGVAILIISIVALKTSPPANVNQLASEYLAANQFPHPLEHRSKGSEEALSQLRNQAASAYIKRDYPSAIALGEKIVQQSPQVTTDDYFFLGLSYLYDNTDNRAVEYLRKAQLASQNSNRFKQEIDWYLALALIKDHQYEAAQSALDHIIENNQWRTKEAKALRKAIDQ